MAIIGKAAPASSDIIERVADLVGCEPAVIDAFIEVEANGEAFDPSDRLIIRPEAHKVKSCPYLDEPEKARAGKLGFTKQPRLPAYYVDAVRAGDKAWAWVDKLASEFGEEAAFWVTSFGAPQIMGFNFRMAGYASPSQMVRAFADSEDEQLMAMGRFLVASGLREACRLRKWKVIARTYNGPAYARNSYDLKLETAYNSSARAKSSGMSSYDDDVLEVGDRGPLVKAIQDQLRALGFYVDNDGDFGPETKDAVRAFQSRRGLTVDGKVGPATTQALREAPPKEPNGKPLKELVKDSQTVQGGIGAVATGAIAGGVGVANNAAPPPPSFAIPDMKDVEGALKASEQGIGLASKILAIGVDKMLIALAVAGLIFGAWVIIRRIDAQRKRKVG